MIRQSLLPLTALAALTCSRTPSEPSGANCALAPIVAPAAPANQCNAATPSCPLPRPAGARTLISMLACAFPAGSIPCAVPVAVCPQLDQTRLVHFIASENDTSACVSTVDVQIGPTESGGVDIDWQARERRFLAGDFQCSIVRETNGHASVPGACCEGVVDISLTEIQRRFRLSVRTDWQR